MSAAVSVTKRHKKELEDAIQLAEEALAQSDSEKARTYLQQCTETGTNTEVNAKRELQRHKKAGKLTRERIVKAGFLCPKGDLQTLGYLTEVPAKWGPGGTKVNGIGEKHTCTRCSTLFRVAPLRRTKEEEGQDAEACRFHPGRPRREPTSDAKTRKVQRWTCCGRTVDAQALGDDRCAAGPHVFKEDSEEELHQRAAYTTFERLAQELDIDDGALEVAALDCEMSYTTAGLSLTRVTLIDENGDIVLDELVRCTSGVQILDYNTQFSGIQPEDYEKNAVLDLDSVRRALAQYIGKDTILVGEPTNLDRSWARKRFTCDPHSAHQCGGYMPAISASTRSSFSHGTA
ncbi:RNA exonuclease 3 [Malassezia psittaci]|uniref:RNA exonuclease 3 n=1 Tax=Malassezia psittaci TaxID=1821823 RepID=A0AAF0FCN1_9BASI|nr:RNA exonuclease 3 [Malassezia psittaci]